jgi:hypothetical protein
MLKPNVLGTVLVVMLHLNLTGCLMSNTSTTMSSREKADYLVQEIGRRAHVPNARLDQDDDRCFGEFGLHYLAAKDILQARVLIARAHTKRSPESAANFRKVAQALNDPRLGGMFETDGGSFLLDENKDLYFLVKDFSVATTTAPRLWDDVQHLLNLGATWTLNWFAHVADMAHGHEAPPTQKVTLANNPYRRQ